MGKCIRAIVFFAFLLSFKSLVTSEENSLASLAKYDYIKNASTCLHGSESIDQALDEMAQNLTPLVEDKNPIMISVLKGGLITAGKLIPKLDFPLEIDYVHASRYHKTETAELKWFAKPSHSLKDRVVVLIDDIIDKGLTLQALVEFCYSEGAKKVYTVVLIDKETKRDVKGLYQADVVGLTIPDEFIVGFGLDYDGYFRNLPDIRVLNQDTL